MGRFQPLCHKTKSCKYHAAGRCKKGLACTFAHGPTELMPRPVLPDGKAKAAGAAAAGQPMVPDPGAAPANAVLRPQGMVLEPELRMLQLPQAPLGMDDLRLADDGQRLLGSPASGLEEDSPQSEGAEEAEGDTPKVRTRLNKFHKTQLCMFHQMGKCKKRASCRFAHGTDELRPVPDLYRTKLCPTMLEAGVCADEECRFAHSAEELRSFEEELAAQEGLDLAQGSEANALVPAYLAAMTQPAAPGLGGSLGGQSVTMPSGPPELQHLAHPAELRPPPEPLRGQGSGPAPGGGAAWLPWHRDPCWGAAAAAEAAFAEAGVPGLVRGGACLPPGLGKADLGDMAHSRPPWHHTLGNLPFEPQPRQGPPGDALLGGGLGPQEPEYQPTVPGSRLQAALGGPSPASGSARKQPCPAPLSSAFAHSVERARLAPQPPAAAAYPGSAVFGDPLLAPADVDIHGRALGAVGLPPGDLLHWTAAHQQAEAYRLDWPDVQGARAAALRSAGAGTIDEWLPEHDVQRRSSDPLLNFGQCTDGDLRRLAHSVEELKRYGVAGPGDERRSQPMHPAMALAYLNASSQDAALHGEPRLAPSRLDGVLSGPRLSSTPAPRQLDLSGLPGQGGYRDLDDWTPARVGMCAGQGPLVADAAAGLRAREEATFTGPMGGEPALAAERVGPDLEPRVLRLRVKNTFLTVQEPSSWKERPRSRTLPVPSMFDDEEGGGLDASMASGASIPPMFDSAERAAPSMMAPPQRCPPPPPPMGREAPWPGRPAAFADSLVERAAHDRGSRPAGPEAHEGGALGSVAGPRQEPLFVEGFDRRFPQEPGPAHVTSPSSPWRSAHQELGPAQEPSVPRLRVKNTFLTVEDPAHVEPLPRSRTMPVPSAAELEGTFGEGGPLAAQRSSGLLLSPPGAPGLAPGLAEAEAPPPPAQRHRGGLVRRGTLLPKIGEAAEGAGPEPVGLPLHFQAPLGGFGQPPPDTSL